MRAPRRVSAPGGACRLLWLVGAVGALLLAPPAWAADVPAPRAGPLAIARAPAAGRTPLLARHAVSLALPRVASAPEAAGAGPWRVCERCPRKKRWDATIGPYAWLAAVSGTAYEDGRSTDFDISFDQIAEVASGGFMLYAEVGYDRWFASFDGTWAVLQSDYPWALGSVGFKQKQTILEFRIGYRLLGRSHGEPAICRCSRCPPAFRDRFALDVYAGARYWDSETTLRLGIGPASFEGTTKDDWVDGLLGVRMGYQLAPKWTVNWRIDLAGFDIRDSSTLTAYSFLGFDWRFAKRWSLGLGYRAMTLDRVTGSGADRNGVKTIQQGPVIGLLLHL